jgi:hypothetical protein
VEIKRIKKFYFKSDGKKPKSIKLEHLKKGFVRNKKSLKKIVK